MEHFIPKFAKLDPQEVIDTEFVVSQSLNFQFWVRTPEKALCGWALDVQASRLLWSLLRHRLIVLQSRPKPDTKAIQKALSTASSFLSASRLTDAELIYTPSQVALGSFRLANKGLVDELLEWKYAEKDVDLPFGIPKDRLLEILGQVEEVIKTGEGDLDRKTVKDIDKRLKQCSNPAKIPGTAL